MEWINKVVDEMASMTVFHVKIFMCSFRIIYHIPQLNPFSNGDSCLGGHILHDNQYYFQRYLNT